MKNNADKTSELLASLSTIHSKEDFEAYLNTHTQTEFSFSQYYNSILHCKNISLAEAVKNSTLERHYAYQIVNGTKAPQAAGKIHSDIEKGFIRAEIVSFDDLQACGSQNAAKEKGLVRSEGKEYVMQDGDIVLFRFNV